jgi:hypothetical protein
MIIVIHFILYQFIIVKSLLMYSNDQKEGLYINGSNLSNFVNKFM